MPSLFPRRPAYSCVAFLSLIIRYKVPLAVGQEVPCFRKERIAYYFCDICPAYSIPADSIDDIKGADSIAKDIHPAAATA